jgi:hypothetical protein
LGSIPFSTIFFQRSYSRSASTSEALASSTWAAMSALAIRPITSPFFTLEPTSMPTHSRVPNMRELTSALRSGRI